MALDNFDLVLPFVPEKDDEDTFIYTEMLDRGKKKGNNGARLVKTFFHTSREEFREQWQVIKKMCDLSLVRACTRLAPKSYERVSNQFTKMVVEANITNNHRGQKSMYNRACGITPPNVKMWLFDVDVLNERTAEFGTRLDNAGHMLARIPSKKGMHYIVRPFDTRIIEQWYQEIGLNIAMKDGQPVDEISLHKDNPTNLYIPDGAD